MKEKGGGWERKKKEKGKERDEVRRDEKEGRRGKYLKGGQKGRERDLLREEVSRYEIGECMLNVCVLKKV